MMPKTLHETPTQDIYANLQRMLDAGEIDKRRLMRALRIRPTGRPPKPSNEKRSATVTIRLTTAEKRQIQRVARERKTTVTNLLLTLALQAQVS